jgi:hypothetical protein
MSALLSVISPLSALYLAFCYVRESWRVDDLRRENAELKRTNERLGRVLEAAGLVVDQLSWAIARQPKGDKGP